MKITSVETIPVSLPVGKFADGCDKVGGKNHPPKFYTGRSPKDYRRVKETDTIYLSNVIVRIVTDDGLVGVGEAACDSAEPVWNVKGMIDHYMAPKLIGENPLDFEFLIDLVSIDAQRGATRFSVSGIDLALYDLVGKILDVPAHSLLGGYRREKVLASIEVPRNQVDLHVNHCREYYDQGVRGFKAKIGSDPVKDAELIKAIWDELGDGISLRADANRGYTVKEAITFCNLVEQTDAVLEVLEQPVGTLDLDGCRAVREATSIPVEVDESAFSLEMVHNIIAAGAADLINTKCAKAMGMKGVREWGVLARAADLEIVIGTEWGAGSKVAAKLHLGSAIPNANPVVEFTEIMIHELLLKEPIRLQEGYLDVPTGPGLGLELDNDKIEEYRTKEASV